MDVNTNASRAESAVRPSAEAQEDGSTQEEEGVESCVIDHIVNHGELDGVLRFRVRWYGYSSKDDTWEPPEHVPRSQVIAYYRRRGISIPGSVLNRTIPG